MDKVQQEKLYNEITRIYDFARNIVDSVEMDKEHMNMNYELVRPIALQLETTANVLGENYLDFLENDMKPTKKNMKEIEVSIRALFETAAVFIDRLEALPEKPSQTVETLSGDLRNVLEEVDDNVLPTQEELGVGKIRKTLERLIKTRAHIAHIIRACEQAFTHVFRIAYKFAQKAIGLVADPKKLIWGRTLADRMKGLIFGKEPDSFAAIIGRG